MFCVSCDKTFSRRNVMLRHFRNKHGTSHPYPQNHRAYPPPPPSSPIQTYQQSRSHHVYPPPPPPPPSPIQTYKQSRIFTTATTTTTAAAAATNEVENEFRFHHPFTANITGPTDCGKTYFVKRCYKTVGPRWRHRRRESSGCTRVGNSSTTSSERPCSHE